MASSPAQLICDTHSQRSKDQYGDQRGVVEVVGHAAREQVPDSVLRNFALLCHCREEPFTLSFALIRDGLQQTSYLNFWHQCRHQAALLPVTSAREVRLLRRVVMCGWASCDRSPSLHSEWGKAVVKLGSKAAQPVGQRGA